MNSGKVISCFFFLIATVIGILIYIREKSKLSDPLSWSKIGISCSGILFIIILILCLPNYLSYDYDEDSIEYLL
jgi:hypothetical protein